MSSLTANRVFVTDRSEFGNVTRPFLGIAGSKVVVADSGESVGYAGRVALEDVVYTATGKNLLDQSFPLPLDFRIVGIQIMTAIGIPTETQATMFSNFMTNFTAQQRQGFIAAFGAVDKNNPAAVNAFVSQMISRLT